MKKTYEGARAPFIGWRFELDSTSVADVYLLRHLERSEEWRQERLLFAANNFRVPWVAEPARQAALATEWPTELREAQWLTEWLKAGLIREVRS